MQRQSRAVTLCIPELGVITSCLGLGPPIGYTLIGRSSKDTLTNKTLRDSTNNIAANELAVGSAFYQIAAGITAGAVLTFDGTRLAFVEPGAAAILGTNTPYGFETLNSLTSGTQNSAFGYRSVFNNTSGVENTGVGMESLYYNNTGIENAAFGSRALGNHAVSDTSILSYSFNAAFGSHAMMLHKSGNWNVACGTSCMRGAIPSAVAPALIFHESNACLGNECMSNCYNAVQNTAAGRDAMKSAGQPLRNCAFGYQALFCREAGDITLNAPGDNCVFGTGSLYAGAVNYTGTFNCVFGNGIMTLPTATQTGVTAMGYQACWRSTADYTTAVGYRALRVATGIENTAFGRDAGVAVTSGSGSTYVGHFAGNLITIGSNNTFIGNGTDGNANSRSGAIALGSGAIAQVNGEFALGSAAVPINLATTPVVGGVADATPAQPVSYLQIRINGTLYKMALYT